MAKLLDGWDVRRHQDHLRSHPATEQWGCFDQAEGSENKGSSESEEIRVPQRLPVATQNSEKTAVPVPLGAPVPLDTVPTSPA